MDIARASSHASTHAHGRALRMRTDDQVEGPVETAAREFREIYDAWSTAVGRWIDAMGGPSADRDDIIQEVFLSVRRRLPSFDGGNVPGWLFRITTRQVRDFRRRFWFKTIFSKAAGVPLEEIPDEAVGPVGEFESRERRQLLQVALGQMKSERRGALILFELEGRSGEEIARIQDVPLATVWTRLHHARKELAVIAGKVEKTKSWRKRSAGLTQKSA